MSDTAPVHRLWMVVLYANMTMSFISQYGSVDGLFPVAVHKIITVVAVISFTVAAAHHLVAWVLWWRASG